MPDVRIIIEEGGGYVVEGDIRLTDEDGRDLDLPYDVQLCRCGPLRKPTLLRWHARRDRL